MLSCSALRVGHVDQANAVGVAVGDGRALQVAVADVAGETGQVTRRGVGRRQGPRPVVRAVVGQSLQAAQQRPRVLAQRRVGAGDQGQGGGHVRGGHRGALDGRVALPVVEPGRRAEEEARDLGRPVGGDVELLPGVGQVLGGVGEPGGAAPVELGQVELARPTRTGDVDPRAVVRVVGQLVLPALTGRLVAVGDGLAGGVVVRGHRRVGVRVTGVAGGAGRAGGRGRHDQPAGRGDVDHARDPARGLVHAEQVGPVLGGVAGGGELAVADDPAATADPDVLVAGGGDDDRALAAGVGHRADVGLVDQLLVGVGALELAAEGDVVHAQVGGGDEGGDLGGRVRVPAPLGDLQRHQVDLGGDAVDALAVEGGGDVAADPGAVAVPVGLGRPAELGGQVVVGQ